MLRLRRQKCIIDRTEWKEKYATCSIIHKSNWSEFRLVRSKTTLQRWRCTQYIFVYIYYIYYWHHTFLFMVLITSLLEIERRVVIPHPSKLSHPLFQFTLHKFIPSFWLTVTDQPLLDLFVAICDSVRRLRREIREGRWKRGDWRERRQFVIINWSELNYGNSSQDVEWP